MAVNKKTSTKTKKSSSKKTETNSTDKALAVLQAKYGVETIRKISDRPQVPRLSTELLGLDELLGGGIPLGRIIEIYGPESSGKTTVAVTIGGAFQRAGKRLAVIDVEQALDPEWCKTLGCDIDDAIHVQPESGEDALNITNEIMKADLADVLIVDSVAALTTKAELEKELGDATMGQQAKLMSTSLKQLIGTCNKSNKTIIFINQMRKKIGVMFGNPETTSGGEALKYYATIRLDVRRIGTRKEGDIALGNDVRIKSIKNKTFRPFVTKEFFLSFTGGYDKTEDLIKTAISKGVINQGGAWLSYGDLKVQGAANLSMHLKENPELYNEIYKKTLGIIKSPGDSVLAKAKDDKEEVSDSEESKEEQEEVVA